MYNLQKSQEKLFYNVDSAVVKNGKFQLRSTVQLPEVYGLTVDSKKAPLFLFLQNTQAVNVVLDTAAYYKNSTVTGSEAQVVFENSGKTPDLRLKNLLQPIRLQLYLRISFTVTLFTGLRRNRSDKILPCLIRHCTAPNM